MTGRILAAARDLVAPRWRVVATLRRSCASDRMVHAFHGLVGLARPYRATFSLRLLESAGGRRRLRVVDLDRHLTRADALRDPVVAEIRAWTAGGPLPREARPA